MSQAARWVCTKMAGAGSFGRISEEGAEGGEPTHLEILLLHFFPLLFIYPSVHFFLSPTSCTPLTTHGYNATHLGFKYILNTPSPSHVQSSHL